MVDRIGCLLEIRLMPAMRIGGFDFFEDGKTAAVCTWDGGVWIVSDIDEKLNKVSLETVCHRFARTARTGHLGWYDLHGRGQPNHPLS